MSEAAPRCGVDLLMSERQGIKIELGIEALIPANGQTGRAIGAVAQLHWYFDDLFPRTLGKPVLSW
jgi:hypothetical protein